MKPSERTLYINEEAARTNLFEIPTYYLIHCSCFFSVLFQQYVNDTLMKRKLGHPDQFLV